MHMASGHQIVCFVNENDYFVSSSRFWNYNMFFYPQEPFNGVLLLNIYYQPPEGRAGHRAGGEETDSGRQFRVPRRGSVRRREDGERGTSKSTSWSERVESS